jgi:hypothetical protein
MAIDRFSNSGAIFISLGSYIFTFFSMCTGKCALRATTMTLLVPWVLLKLLRHKEAKSDVESATLVYQMTIYQMFL